MRVKPEQVIVALDGMSREQALMIAWTLSSSVWGFKVNDLLLAYGLDIVMDLKCLGRVFADPKFYDAPKTVSSGVARLAEAGADFITVHASGGKEMVQAAVESAGEAKVLAVTALTSLDEPSVQEIYCRSADETVWDLAHLAYDAGVHGIVCSSQEVGMLKHLNILKVVPGIRPAPDGDAPGADFFVVGRQITASNDPLKALHNIMKDS